MKALTVNETLNFDREDPNIFSKMGIGVKSFEKLKRGDILKPKEDSQDIHLSARTGKFDSHGLLQIWEDSYVLVLQVDKSNNGKDLIVWYYQTWDLKEAKDRISGKLYWPTKDHFMVGTIKQLEKRFDIL
jgi:hypothetical protein